MLQHLERGRLLEIDALVAAAVREMGRLVEVPTPAIDTCWRSWASGYGWRAATAEILSATSP